MHRPFYGVLLAPTFVLAAYAGQHASPFELMRPLVIFALAAGIAFGIIGILSHRWHAASLLVAFGLVALVRLEFLLLVTVWPVLAWRSATHTGRWGIAPNLTRPLNTFVGAWFVVSVLTAVTVSLPPDSRASEPVTVEPGRNVYLIWLDGYPRHDTLLEYFGFDNRPFLDALEDRGFVVSEQSRSLYTGSIQTMATMMQVRPYDELIEDDWDGSHQQYRRLWHLLNDAPVPAAFEAAGYVTYSIVSPATGHDWRTADVVLDSPWLSDFEAHLFERGVLRPFLPLAAMHRADILDAFDYLEASAGRSRRFVFAHILKPHGPYVFDADGGPAEPCGRLCRRAFGPPNPTLGDRLIGQVRWLNGRVLDAVDHITAVDPDGVVVVFSDHGLRRDPNDMDEWFRTLFAARNHQFPRDIATSELIPALSEPLRAER